MSGWSFSGDAVLGFVAAEYLYRNEPSLPEGEMTRMRADLVCETNLARAAERIGLGIIRSWATASRPAAGATGPA